MKWMWVIPVVLLALGARAQTEPPGTRKPEKLEVSLLADFGLGGKVPAGKFAPVRVWVQAAETNLSGWVEVEVVSGAGLSWRAVAPVEAAAGALTSVPIVTPMPEYCERLTLTLRTTEGGRVARTEYSPLPGATSIQLPALMSSREELLVSLTPRVSAGRLVEKFVAASLDPGVREPISGKPIGPEMGVDLLGRPLLRLDLLGSTAGANVTPESMPMSEWAYEGAMAAIVDGAALREADPRAVQALRRWVLGGGRVVILADQPGASWRELLPPGAPAGAIEVGAPSEVRTPEEIRSLLRGRGLASVNARAMRLTLAAQEIGWRERWGIEEGALIVEGPAGLGWVTMVSVHPDFVGALDESWLIWQDVLRPAMEIVQSGASGDGRTMHTPPGWGYNYSLGRMLPSVVFDAIGRATPVGAAAVALVAIVTASLAILLGPGDFFLLKVLRRRQLAWLSALVWIGLASVIAVVVPGRLRAGPSTASRLTVIQAMVQNSELSAEHPAQRAIAEISPGLRGQRIGLTHLFAGSSEAFRVESDGVWFEHTPWTHERTVARRPLTVTQRPGESGFEHSRRAAPERVDAGQWSVRTLIDQSPVDPGLVARLARAENGWALELTGLGAGAKILSGQLEVGGEYFRLGERYLVTHPGETARVVFDDSFRSASAAPGWKGPSEPDPDRPYYQWWQGARRVEDLSPSALLALPGAAERGWVTRAYAETGGYALVSLFMSGQAMDIGIESGQIERTRASVYRLVVPVEEGADRD